MRDELRRGLLAAQKTLPSSLLYDALGSVLFEAITELPEYEVARADLRVLSEHARDAMPFLEKRVDVVELGPGHGRKARVVLAEVQRRQSQVDFVAIDVAAAALEGCKRQLEDMEGVKVTGVEDTFIAGLRRAPRFAPRRLVLFLGSNLSNFDRRESLAFFNDVRATMEPGDALLLSADLEKPPAQLLPAYDDALGVTAAFNRNLLVRLNREYRADFDVSAFAHEVRWNAEPRRIEMHLRATRACEVSIPGLELSVRFAANETVWTESSHRFNVNELNDWGREARFSTAATWVDRVWPLALTLFIAQ
ncbi:MAG: L-histidine N(alpha)-methyltransferase [Myxococcaceae bacterium]